MYGSRFQALLCALAFSLCELASKPFAATGICDDWSYVRTAEILSRTGHIVYNGWATAMIGWQLYAAAAAIKLLGHPFSSARMTTLLVGAVCTFFIHRIFVRAGVSDRNATLGTLAFVLSPLYMLLSSTFMTDVPGLFAIVICAYGCMRALQAAGTREAVLWLLFAAVANALIGTSRQIAWLGVLVMIPCAAWTMRDRRKVLWSGWLIAFMGAVFVMACMRWFHQQPYTLPESLVVHLNSLHEIFYMARQLSRGLLEIPFLILPILALFLGRLRRSRGMLVTVLAIGAVYALLAVRAAKHHGADVLLEPLLSDWVSPQGFYGIEFATDVPVALTTWIRALLTALTLGGTVCAVFFLLQRPGRVGAGNFKQGAGRPITWGQLGYLFLPVCAINLILLIPRSTANLLDRYLLFFALVAAIFSVRAYQHYVRPELPRVTGLLIALVALFSIAGTHDMFALYRARLQMADEMAQAGVPDTAIDAGWDYDGMVELDHGGHINDNRLVNPPDSFVPVDKFRGRTCSGTGETDPGLLHFSPLYGIAFRPNACFGPAPFAPVSYSRWLALRPATLYAVRYGPLTGQ